MSISTAPPCGHPEARLSSCALLLVFALGPSWFEAWICLHMQTHPHCKSFHLFKNVHFCTFLIEEPRLQEVRERNFAQSVTCSGRLERTCGRKEKVILIVLILQMIYHMQIYAEVNFIHNYLSLPFSRNVYVCLGES